MRAHVEHRDAVGVDAATVLLVAVRGRDGAKQTDDLGFWFLFFVFVVDVGFWLLKFVGCWLLKFV